ncbi:hypothetical protein OG758_00260 [Streptomyces sp. NBC_01474]|nr:hypothetical protein [Streptomyces sp. NBC_01474]WSD92800.1 hypothetical protein OG758_00260 [Streptomyces sp. NBC_01474]
MKQIKQQGAALGVRMPADVLAVVGEDIERGTAQVRGFSQRASRST